MTDEQKIIIWGAPWCPDCKRAKTFLAEHRIPYEWVDIDEDPQGLAYVERIQNGGRTIPAIRFPDGSHLFEPGNDELAEKLHVNRDRCAATTISPSSAEARPGWPPRSTR